MNPTYAVYTHIERDVTDVFQALQSQEMFSKVFTPTSGDLEEGAELTWGMRAAEVQVRVDKVVQDERIEITFKPADFTIPELRPGDKRDYEARIVILFEAADVGGTLVTLCEYGWQDDMRSVLQSYGHCGGWQTMLLCLKAQLQHGIDLSTPNSVRPDYQALWSAPG
ncbi:MAG: SRPBCC domain-containing protein [Pseudomonadota bacterium]